MNLTMLMLATALQLPVPIQWQFDGPTLSNKTYIADLDYIKANTDVDVINIAPVQGAAPEGNRLFHDALKELVEHAHKLGIRIVVRASPAQPQLFDAIFTPARATRIIDEPDGAQGLTYDAEAKLDTDGCATFTEEARWALQVPKVTPPLRNDVVGAWVFEKTGGPVGDGCYRKGTLVDVTDRIKVLKRTAGDGSTLLALFNLGFDPLESVRLRVPAAVVSVERLDAHGVWRPVDFAAKAGEVEVKTGRIACCESVILKVIGK